MGDDRAIFAGEPILRGETIFRRFKTFPNCYRGQKGRIFNGPTMLLREKKKKKKKNGSKRPITTMIENISLIPSRWKICQVIIFLEKIL